ncbi:MAG TPA: class I SAM-dependent methyltransferase [bacterium]|jgi:SAM-dependent methyltransferase|nr:methyltransferase domain-containing protein [Candidatus Omnitrophota bacterium]HOJ61313.1 class I SAM-dependent methyltransferase [bacterium]HOL96738.1 class I SAM-dependent methyltransferase [bacterium]HPP00269.1 class I SAM-dependent methyltransferase [bacterium]
MTNSDGYHDPFIARTYDLVVPYRHRRDVEFFVEMARAAGGPVLELACGTGRVLLPIARAGVPITGLDLSPAMLAVCRERLALEPPAIQEKVHLMEGDMRRFAMAERFALVLIPFRSFQHLLTVEDQLACLQRCRDHLKEHGQLVLDLFNPCLSYLSDERFLEVTESEPEFILDDGTRIVRQNRLLARDLFNQVIDMEFLYRITYPGGRHGSIAHRFSMRYLFRYEVEHLLERAGFQVEAVYADYKKAPYGSQYPGELIVVARKR